MASLTACEKSPSPRLLANAVAQARRQGTPAPGSGAAAGSPRPDRRPAPQAGATIPASARPVPWANAAARASPSTTGTSHRRDRNCSRRRCRCSAEPRRSQPARPRGMVRSSCPRVGTPSIVSSRPSPGAAILPGFSWLRGSNAAFIACRHGIERPEELRRELRAHALAMLAPQQAVVLAGQRDDLLGHLADQRFLFRDPSCRSPAERAGRRHRRDRTCRRPARAGPARRGTRRCNRRGSPAERPCPPRRGSAACRPACCRAGRPTSCASPRCGRRPSRPRATVKPRRPRWTRLFAARR